MSTANIRGGNASSLEEEPCLALFDEMEKKQGAG